MTVQPMIALRLFDGAAVASATPFAALVAALRTAFAEGVEVPARHVHTWPDGDGGSLTSLLMPAWTRPGPQGSGFYGVKIINVAPGNAAPVHSTLA
jgi:ornithine cyclodeaminase